MKDLRLKNVLCKAYRLIALGFLSLLLLSACGGGSGGASPDSVKTFTITTTAGANGSITATASVESGADKIILMTPDFGFIVLDVKVDGTSIGAKTFYEFTNISASHTVEVAFVTDNKNNAIYKMPVGVPEPSIDFRQDKPPRPSDWSVEIPGYYYIDTVNGLNNQDYGTPSTPRKYLPRTLTGGAYIEIAGDYDHGLKPGNYLKLSYEGTDDKSWNAGRSGPVWITKAQDKQGAFTKIKVILTGANIFLTDMIFKEGANPQVGSVADGFATRNMVIRNVDVTGRVSVNGFNTQSASDNIVIYNSSFHHAGDVNADYDQDSHIITINGFASNVWLLGNKMHTASGAGLQIHGGFNNSHNVHNIYVAGNEVYNVRQSGLWVKSGKNIVISSNHVYDIIDTPWSASKGIGAQYEPDGLWIINNHIHGAKYGIRVGSTTSTTWRQKLYLIGNVIHDINALGVDVGPRASTSSWQPAAIHLAGMHDHFIYNNLIFDAPNGIDISGPSITKIRNNIILDVSESHPEGENGYHIWAELQDLNDKVFIDNNYFGIDMNVKIRHDDHASSVSLNDHHGANENVAGYNFITAENITALMSGNADEIDFSQVEDLGINVDDILMTHFRSIFPDTKGLDSALFGVPYTLGSAIDIGPFEQD